MRPPSHHEALCTARVLRLGRGSPEVLFTKNMARVSPKGTKATATSANAQELLATASSTISKHAYTSSNSRSQSPVLSPMPDSDPDTPGRPDGKRLKGDISLTDLQNNMLP
ncbi:uncharacterized protein AKAME5_000000900 [Lates japonicus]|uniref:Uncharacterized protein n=1 Tax=Lates japonicus TaxID=270547 RepID=A0AAD3QUT5_LATJO|nr:uncharacterized protein AKAME5_000000900 [Lates japonicus]